MYTNPLRLYLDMDKKLIVNVTICNTCTTKYFIPSNVIERPDRHLSINHNGAFFKCSHIKLKTGYIGIEKNSCISRFVDLFEDCGVSNCQGKISILFKTTVLPCTEEQHLGKCGALVKLTGETGNNCE